MSESDNFNFRFGVEALKDGSGFHTIIDLGDGAEPMKSVIVFKTWREAASEARRAAELAVEVVNAHGQQISLREVV